MHTCHPSHREQQNTAKHSTELSKQCGKQLSTHSGQPIRGPLIISVPAVTQPEARGQRPEAPCGTDGAAGDTRTCTTRKYVRTEAGRRAVCGAVRCRCAAGAGVPLYEERGVGVWVWGGVVGAQFSWCLGGACIPIAPHPDTLAHALQEYKGRLCWGKLWYCGTVVQLQ